MTIQIRTIMRLGQLKQGDRVFSVPSIHADAPHGWGVVIEGVRHAEVTSIRIRYDDAGIDWGTFVDRITQWQPKEKKDG